ncbi:HD-GYP domain-containing protein [Pseudomonas otitidis]|uniref:HD-GYP domain-containing protein n=1 Tax=Metapseudomonas otitidis TaxID=319939 RepID=A0ABU3XP86_9GAMM|nr:HD-GYP domain-containing protein [Pseudomonas otitidis]MDH1105797.1 HD-GYP domain-containing protein [Pseudomonas otitidis]MDH1156944.1 HD-GYP domain-containing protein [Pseudomonas otitidis]MDH1162248.1 HD-GYP domain-containing protein [Pseudomonas otitidis]MDV3439740.1 HD-GYP domain-containing protein [Pseudomonas otitidis]MEE1896056.1 HD-GYP domain-containing protein [Pseudomonas otitidis]
MTLKRIATTDLQLGMYVQEFCGSWMDHPFFRAKFVVKTDKDLQRIRNSDVHEVWIDTDKGLDIHQDQPSVSVEEAEAEIDARLAAAEQAPPIERADLESEVSRAAMLCAKAKDAVVSMFSDARMGKAISVDDAQGLVQEISDSVMRHPNALISLARLKTADEYTYMHSVAVCALMIALARQLGLGEAQVREAGLAGLLHDIGKMAIPMDVLNKPGKLTDEEFQCVRKHPEEGARILLESHQVSALVLDVCLHHHEKVDGTGYPHRLAGDQISLLAKMGAVCDVYDAITSDRPYKRGWDPAESIRRMAEWSKDHFDELVFQAFVKSIGIYPTGSLVRLESGRLGVVMEQHEKSLTTPKVKVFYSARLKTAIPQEVVDLAKLAGRDRIVGRESPADWNFRNLDELWSGIPDPRRKTTG